jgi:membrane protein required for colicin V production
MGWLDVVILIVLVAATLVGLKIGIIKAVLSLVGVIVGVVLAGRYYDALAGALTFISQPSVAKIAAFAIILVVVMLAAVVLAWLLRSLASALLMGWLDKVGGAVFGLALGALFSSALLTIWLKTGVGTGTIQDSALAAFLVNALPVALALLPSDFDSIKSFFQ